jgi:hypothetical protein
MVSSQLFDQGRSCKMKTPDLNRFSNDSGVGEAEKTLRLIARLPAPEGLEDRVHAGLHAAPRGSRILAWPVSPTLASGWMRSAAAAAIVFVVAGGGWSIYSRVQPGQPVHGIAGPRIAGPGQFSTGEAVRRPQTLNGPTVTHPAPIKPSQAKVPAKVSKKAALAPTPSAKSTTVSKAAATTAVQ